MKQLSFQFEIECPVCEPSGDHKRDLLRSMCEKHQNEYNTCFDHEGFRLKLREALKKGFEEASRPRPNMRRLKKF